MYGDDLRGSLGWVGAPVADDIVRCYFGDRLVYVISQGWVGRGVEGRGRTPSYVGTRTPSPMALSLRETKIVCADADEAAATRAIEVESFIVRT